MFATCVEPRINDPESVEVDKEGNESDVDPTDSLLAEQ